MLREADTLLKIAVLNFRVNKIVEQAKPIGGNEIYRGEQRERQLHRKWRETD